MDIESLEAANQSLQMDLKLAFKRIGDLQAAIEDEMESDDNDDLINSLQDMVTKYQKRKNKTGDETETDSEVEDRVDGVKSWLSKNKGTTKTQSEDGNLKSTSPSVCHSNLVLGRSDEEDGVDKDSSSQSLKQSSATDHTEVT